ncbi:DUF1499 domain-containing protein [Halopseudomonas laoshanensis]|uniref:DUF1499 domain-containing protein n=1 Tax=Halopseudomonas laoshanensis TaxID=2268758 RepID=A0A7V7KXE1_9GAMM|nr:DUF1499 domain-containing protein [Halopseudomonas laoshanensis]KAA0694576.1 DUF1499 domain-containing protein [Halopseudomonas laoshanensis]
MKTIFIVILALVIAGFAFIYWQNSQVPELGHQAGQLTPLSDKPNGVSTQTADPEKLVMPWQFKADQATTLSAIKDAVAAYGGAELVSEDADYLRYVFVTEKMRFRDDAEFYLDAQTKEVHFRSASRAGKSDLGLNRKRYERLTELYNR